MKETDKRPLVSVSMPTYNHESFISDSIESVLAQGYDNMEIIIVDDASTDRTPEIIKEYDRKYPGLFKIKINEKNLGVTPTCNIALSMCTGEYIAFTSGDDVWLPGKLNKQIAKMEEDVDCVLVYHDIEIFNDIGNRTIQYLNSGNGSVNAYEGNCIDIGRLVVERGTEFMAAISIMVRRDHIPPWGFDNRVITASDWLMWVDILVGAPGTVKFIPEVLARYRRHDKNVSNDLNLQDRYITLAIIEGRYPWLVKSVCMARSYVYYVHGMSCIRKGYRKLGCQLVCIGMMQSIYSWRWVLQWLGRNIQYYFLKRFSK